MLIDFHTHIFPDKIASATINALASNSNSTPYTDGTAEGMISAMERADADIVIALPVLTKPTQFESVTNFAISINEKYKDSKRRIISFGGMHPLCDGVDEKLAYLKSVGIKGIKIHPDYQNTYIDDQRYINIIKCAKKYDLIVITHSGVDDGYPNEPVKCTPDRILKVLEQVSYNKFVLGHFGAHKQWAEVLTKLAGKDLYFDTAMTVNEIDANLFKDIVLKHGADKILFATDCPWQDIKNNCSVIKGYNLSKEIEDKIFYKNALNLLKL